MAALKKQEEAIQARLRQKLAALETAAVAAAARQPTRAAVTGAAAAPAPPQHVCYLCRKKFKTEAMLLLHNAESQLHKDNLRNQQHQHQR